MYINTLMVQQIFTDDTWFERMTPEDFRALTPLAYAHINPYGTFELDMQQHLHLDFDPYGLDHLIGHCI